jgi:two-component system, response regulator YesN
MEKTLKQNSDRTNPLLLSARTIVKEYAKATGARISIHDHNYEPINISENKIFDEAENEFSDELFDELFNGDNSCLLCIRNQNRKEDKNLSGPSVNLCREMHINAIKEGQRLGTAYTYACPSGFIFWTSPIFLNGHFAGALLGGGFFKDGSQKIKALTELLFICAQSISIGSDGFNKETRHRILYYSLLSEKIEELKTKYSQDDLRPEYPLDKERMFLDVLASGDNESAKQILNEILALLIFANPNQFKYVQYRALELAVLISRIGANFSFTMNAMLENGNLYAKLIQETKNAEELAYAMYRIVDDMAEQIHGLQGIQHVSVLKKAEDFILENLSRKISLKEISKAAGFSSPYFSTLFKEEMGENFSSYLNRLRVKKASALLTSTNLSLSRIAVSCGFKDQSWFSKIFKHYTGICPGKYRSQGGKITPKIPGTRFSEDFPVEIA